MTATTIKPFRHANTGITYLVGDEFEGTDEQARELCAKGYLEIVDEAPQEGETEADEVALEDMTVAQLRAICEEYGIPAPAKAKKENLVAAVKLYEAEATEDDSGDEAAEAEDE